MKNFIAKKKIAFFTTGILFIFVLWYILFLTIKNDAVIPSVSASLKALGSLGAARRTYLIILKTILRLFVCLGVSFIISLLLAIFAIKFKSFRVFISPLISLFKTLPIVVIIILLILIFKRDKAFYFIVGIVIIPLLYEAIYAGMNNIDTAILEDIKTISNTNIKVIMQLYLPLSWPYILTGLLQAFGLGLKVLVMAEYISQPRDSIGAEILFYNNNVMMEYVYAWSIILVLFVLIIELTIKLLNKKLKLT